VDFDKHKTDPKTEPLTKVASDILGLDYVELKPLLPVLGKEKKKVVSIAIHATAQSKYWNNPTGWQEVTDYLLSLGYEVKLLSKEENGYMGNFNPKGVTKVKGGSLENIIKIIQESELFIGLSSGLSWVSWAVGTETILISGFTDDYTEPLNGVRRIINKNVCYGCWNRHNFDPGDWNWCPDHKGTDRQFECTKMITSNTVIEQINLALGL
jgi:autotransporter strand-loop-strand O-heptosyltransferase